MSKNKKVVDKTLEEISQEVVEIVNNEDDDYTASEKVLEYLAYNLHVSKDFSIKVNI